MRIRKRLPSQSAATLHHVAAGFVSRKPTSSWPQPAAGAQIHERLEERIRDDDHSIDSCVNGASVVRDKDMSLKLCRGTLMQKQQKEAKDINLHLEQEIKNVAASDSDDAAGQENSVDYKMQDDDVDDDEDDQQRCGRRSGQGWQCRNKRAPDGGSIYCEYHQSKIAQHHAAWSARNKSWKQEDKLRIRESSSFPAQNNMVDVKVLELPLFPSKQQYMFGNLQGEDMISSEAGADLLKRMSKAGRCTKVQQTTHTGTDDLDLKLAPNSVVLPNLVETNTKPCAQPAQNGMESAGLDTFSCKRRRIESAATSDNIGEFYASNQRLCLTDVDILCKGPEHLCASTVFGSTICNMQEDSNRCKGSILKLTSGISTVGDKQGTSDYVVHVKSKSDRTSEQELVQNDTSLSQQVPFRSSNMLIKEQDVKSTVAHINKIEVNEQGHVQQMRQCKRHDGRGWRCKRLCAQGAFYCEHHAQKQRNYQRAIKITGKDNLDGLQQHLPDKGLELIIDFCKNIDDVADGSDRNSTGTLRKVHQQTCKIEVQKDMSNASESVGGLCRSGEENDGLQDKARPEAGADASELELQACDQHKSEIRRNSSRSSRHVLIKENDDFNDNKAKSVAGAETSGRKLQAGHKAKSVAVADTVSERKLEAGDQHKMEISGNRLRGAESKSGGGGGDRNVEGRAGAARKDQDVRRGAGSKPDEGGDDRHVEGSAGAACKDKDVLQARVLSIYKGAGRCGRQDGRGWQCKSKRVEGSIYCEHHKERVRSYHAAWNANSVILQKKRNRNKVKQPLHAEQISDIKSNGDGEEKLLAVAAAADDDSDKPVKSTRAASPALDVSTPGKRKRKFLHHIYARCSTDE